MIRATAKMMPKTVDAMANAAISARLKMPDAMYRPPIRPLRSTLICCAPLLKSKMAMMTPVTTPIRPPQRASSVPVASSPMPAPSRMPAAPCAFSATPSTSANEPPAPAMPTTNFQLASLRSCSIAVSRSLHSL
ncbi:hypothetical protein D3C72_2116450 [compost metagenome]